MIVVVDYGIGNRRSVEKALLRVGAAIEVSGDHDRIAAADGLVLPGVGAFGQGMASLRGLGLDVVLRERAAAGVPLLGLCLGMQLLFDTSDEFGHHAGLGLIPGTVRRMQPGTLAVPHIGWNEVRFVRDSPLLAKLPAGGAPFYHVHSYVVEPRDRSDVIGTTTYGEEFPTIVGRGSTFGAQFHPEKSSRDGLALLSGFAVLCSGLSARAAA